MWNFPTKQRIFQNILGSRKKTQGIFQKTQGFEKKTQSFGGKEPQVASQKLGKKTPWFKRNFENQNDTSKKQQDLPACPQNQNQTIKTASSSSAS